MAERLYFAYGSNINLEQMAVRCPAAQVVGPAVLDGYELPSLPSSLCLAARSTAFCGS